MSDAFWGSLFTALTTIIILWMQQRNAAHAAIKLSEQTSTIQESLKEKTIILTDKIDSIPAQQPSNINIEIPRDGMEVTRNKEKPHIQAE